MRCDAAAAEVADLHETPANMGEWVQRRRREGKRCPTLDAVYQVTKGSALTHFVEGATFHGNFAAAQQPHLYAHVLEP